MSIPKPRFASIFLCAASIAIAAQANADIISNGGFEAGTLAPWAEITLPQPPTPGGPEHWNVTSSDAHSGSYSATVDGSYYLFQELTPWTPVKDIEELSFWAKRPTAGSIRAVAIYSTGVGVFVDLPFTTTDTWEKFDITADLNANYDLRALAFRLIDEERAYIDDVAVIVPEPASLTLLALSALLLRRR